MASAESEILAPLFTTRTSEAGEEETTAAETPAEAPVTTTSSTGNAAVRTAAPVLGVMGIVGGVMAAM